jgi:hypothetical protein
MRILSRSKNKLAASRYKLSSCEHEAKFGMAARGRFPFDTA